MSFLLISDNDRAYTKLTASERTAFRADALEIRMYYMPEGSTILITRGQDALLMEGGSGRALRNPALAQAIAGRLQGRQLRAIVASHPHRDHTNSHSGLVNAATFVPGALYFDNGIPAADVNFQEIANDHQSLPFQRVAVFPNQQDTANRIIPSFGGAGANVHILRSSTNSTSHSGQVYWSVFVFLQFRNSWMLFTGDVTTKLYQTRMTTRLQALNPRTHFLTLSHHGNKTGTSEDFVKALRPAIAAASTGDDPGHELDQEVRTRLATVKSRVLATFDPTRVPARQAQDVVIRTDGIMRSVGNVDHVLFEVNYRQPAIHLGG